MISQLINIIGREADLFESFLELLDQQKQMLLTNDPDGLNEVTAKQREQLVESQILNRKREKLTEEIKAINRIEGDLTVTRLLEFADADQAKHLLKLRNIILDLNDRIAQARNTNVMLINRSREFITKTMEMLARINAPDRTYSRDGVNVTGGSNIIVDRRI